MQLLPENQRWLSDFRARHGRAPRILHIGNIANNAYNNAKLLNEVGMDCDVICYDYYHVMGCPEWEDADFPGGIEDDFRPNWTQIDLSDFVRPRWFAQGPKDLCLRYLIARRTGRPDQAILWKELLVASQCALSSGLQHSVPGKPLYAKLSHWTKQLITGDSSTVIQRGTQFCDQMIRGEIKLALVGLGLLMVFLARLVVRPSVSFWRWLQGQNLQTTLDPTSDLIEAYAREFESRRDRLVCGDILPYLSRSSEWKRVFNCYDYVIGYSTDPVIPLISGVPYFAFEHGTIREIPYYETSQGRLTALAYRLAQHVFVTNFDCVGSAQQLAPGRFTIINHPYDEDHGLRVTGWESLRIDLLSELDSEFLFFHPTRQDWVEGTGYADKKNDEFLRAFATLRSDGMKVGLVCCSWGSNVEQTKAMLDQLGCSKSVRWVAPMAITPFERMCKATDIVVDQFKLGAFGGVVFKAMAVGTPILTYLDEQRLSNQYPECPPVLNCRTTDEILAKVRVLISSPEGVARMGNASRAWMKKFHAKEITVNAQVDQFRKHLAILGTCTPIQ